jgi:hypothetical protein
MNYLFNIPRKLMIFIIKNKFCHCIIVFNEVVVVVVVLVVVLVVVVVVVAVVV